MEKRERPEVREGGADPNLAVVGTRIPYDQNDADRGEKNGNEVSPDAKQQRQSPMDPISERSGFSEECQRHEDTHDEQGNAPHIIGLGSQPAPQRLKNGSQRGPFLGWGFSFVCRRHPFPTVCPWTGRCPFCHVGFTLHVWADRSNHLRAMFRAERANHHSVITPGGLLHLEHDRDNHGLATRFSPDHLLSGQPDGFLVLAEL